jgi:hypothetical protein
MRFASAVSTVASANAALRDILDQLEIEAGPRPDFVALHFSPAWPASELQAEAVAAFGDVALHGGSSCLGVMTERGAVIAGGRGMGAFAIWDPGGAYGTGMAVQGDDPRGAARAATEAALVAADRVGEAPELVWLTAAPGAEELVLAGIKDVLGADAVIVGGSAADNDVSGQWSQFDSRGQASDGVVVSVLFPSGPVGCAYESGYAPTATHGRVSRVAGRRLIEIDGRPAAGVYEEWTKGVVAVPTEGAVSVLAASTFHPLGRVAAEVAGVSFHLLAHPAVADANGGLVLFADVAEGEMLWLMSGSADSLVARAGRVAEESLAALPGAARDGAQGALVVYCGGCMLAVQDRMDEVTEGVSRALGGIPFLGIFTFGEQGAPLGGEARHGNLMISCSTFG